MEARRWIAEMCARHRVSLDFGRRLQPLAERAMRSEPEKRRLLLEMLERSFVEESRRAAAASDEQRALATVASVLHGWRPPAWFEHWEDEPPARP